MKKPMILKPVYVIAVNEVILYLGKKYVVQDFNTKTLSFVLLTPEGKTIEAYHKEVQKISKSSSLVNISDN